MESTENKKVQKSKTLIYGGIAVLLLAGGFTVAQTYVNGETEKELNELIAEKSDRISYESASRNMLTGSTRINNLKLSNNGKIVKIDTFIFKSFDKKTDIPDHADVELKGIHLKLSDLRRKESRILSGLGYPEDLTAHAIINYEYKQEDRALLLKKFDLGVDDAFGVSLGFQLSNIDLSNKDDFAKLIMTWEGVKFNSAYFTVTNDGLMSRMIKKRSSDINKTAEEIKKEVIAEIDQKLGANPSEYEQSMRDALKAFIQNESSITTKTGFESPIRIGDIFKVRNPNKIITLLKLDFSEK